MKKADKDATLMEYSSSEKWQLFAQYYKKDWHAGFNLVPEHASDNDLVKIPLVLGTILHVINFGVFTALIPAVCETLAALVGRKPLLENSFDEVKKMLTNLQGDNLEKMCEALADLKPDAEGSKQLVNELNRLSAGIKGIRDAILHEKSEANPEKNPVIAELRLQQKDLINRYFSNRNNMGTKTQCLIADLVLKSKPVDEVISTETTNPFSGSYYD